MAAALHETPPKCRVHENSSKLLTLRMTTRMLSNTITAVGLRSGCSSMQDATRSMMPRGQSSGNSSLHMA